MSAKMEEGRIYDMEVDLGVFRVGEFGGNSGVKMREKAAEI